MDNLILIIYRISCVRLFRDARPFDSTRFVVDSDNTDSSSDERASVSPPPPMSFLPPLGTTHDSGGGNSSSQNYSPICRRHQEDLINAYEAEEERIINVLSRKLEQVCEAKNPPFLDFLTCSDSPSSSKKTTSNWKTLLKQSQNPMSTDYRANCLR